MAASPLNPKTHYHARSVSLPSGSHPLIPQFDDQLCRLQASEATFSTSSSLSNRLSGLREFNNCVGNLVLLPKIQQALAQDKEWVNELLDGFLRLLDACSATQDALLQMNESVQELQSVLPRRRGDEFGISYEVGNYLTQRKKVKKAVQKALRNLNGPVKKNHVTPVMVGRLREVETVTFTVLESLMSFIIGENAQSKPSSWSLVSKLMHPKRVSSEATSEINEFWKLDAALQKLIGHKTSKSVSMQVENAQKELGKLELNIQDLEGGLEFLFKHLIKARVSLLNILNC